MASSRKGYLAVKKEATVALAVKPTNFVRFKDGDVNYTPEVIANNPIQSNRWNAITPVDGKATAAGVYNMDLDVNESVHFLAAAMGSMSTADISSLTDTSVFKHTIDHADSLYGLTFEQGKGNLSDTTNNRQNYQVDRSFGVMVDKFTISGSDGIINMAIDVKAHGMLQKYAAIDDFAAGSAVVVNLTSAEGFVAADDINIFDETPQNEAAVLTSIDIAAKTVTVTTVANSYTVANKAKLELLPQTPSYGTDPAVLSFVNCSFQFGEDLAAAASAEEENVENWELSYMNNLEERWGSKRNSASVIAPKGNQATMKYTKYFENVEDRDRYLDKAKRACILTITNNKIVSATDTNAAKETVKFLMSDVRFTSYDMPTGTDELYAISAELELFYSGSDGRALRIEVTNAKAASVYA